jgi:nucleotide-binding universal stress UspA family protein
MEIRTILVPLDGSGISERALIPAATMAERFGARLVLMQAIPTLATVAAQTAAGNPQATAYVDPGEVHEAQREIAREQMAAARARAGVRVAAADLVEGDPADEILARAEREHADLIVMGTRGQGGLARAVLGSVADAVMRRAPCPVLLVPPEARI